MEIDSGMISFVKDETAVLTGFFATFFADDAFFTAGFATVFVAGTVLDFFGAVVVFFAVDFFGAVFLELDDVLVAVFFLASAIRNEDIK